MGITRMGDSWTLSEQRGSVNGRWRQRDHRAGLRGNSRRRLYVLRSVQETDCLKNHIWRPPPPSTLPHSHFLSSHVSAAFWLPRPPLTADVLCGQSMTGQRTLFNERGEESCSTMNPRDGQMTTCAAGDVNKRRVSCRRKTLHSRVAKGRHGFKKPQETAANLAARRMGQRENPRLSDLLMSASVVRILPFSGTDH